MEPSRRYARSSAVSANAIPLTELDAIQLEAVDGVDSSNFKTVDDLLEDDDRLRRVGCLVWDRDTRNFKGLHMPTIIDLVQDRVRDRFLALFSLLFVFVTIAYLALRTPFREIPQDAVLDNLVDTIEIVAYPNREIYITESFGDVSPKLLVTNLNGDGLEGVVVRAKVVLDDLEYSHTHTYFNTRRLDAYLPRLGGAVDVTTDASGMARFSDLYIASGTAEAGAEGGNEGSDFVTLTFECGEEPYVRETERHIDFHLKTQVYFIDVLQSPSLVAVNTQPFVTQPKVLVTGINGLPLQGHIVWAVIPGEPMGSDSFSIMADYSSDWFGDIERDPFVVLEGNSAVTDEAGVAHFTDLRVVGADDVVFPMMFYCEGEYQMAVDEPIRIVNSVDRVLILQQPASHIVEGKAMNPQPIVQVLDSVDDGIAGIRVIAAVSTRQGSYEPTLFDHNVPPDIWRKNAAWFVSDPTNANGIATWTELAISDADTCDGEYRLSFYALGIPSSETIAITIETAVARVELNVAPTLASLGWLLGGGGTPYDYDELYCAIYGPMNHGVPISGQLLPEPMVTVTDSFGKPLVLKRPTSHISLIPGSIPVIPGFSIPGIDDFRTEVWSSVLSITGNTGRSFMPYVRVVSAPPGEYDFWVEVDGQKSKVVKVDIMNAYNPLVNSIGTYIEVVVPPPAILSVGEGLLSNPPVIRVWDAYGRPAAGAAVGCSSIPVGFRQVLAMEWGYSDPKMYPFVYPRELVLSCEDQTVGAPLRVTNSSGHYTFTDFAMLEGRHVHRHVSFMAMKTSVHHQFELWYQYYLGDFPSVTASVSYPFATEFIPAIYSVEFSVPFTSSTVKEFEPLSYPIDVLVLDEQRLPVSGVNVLLFVADYPTIDVFGTDVFERLGQMMEEGEPNPIPFEDDGTASTTMAPLPSPQVALKLTTNATGYASFVDISFTYGLSADFRLVAVGSSVPSEDVLSFHVIQATADGVRMIQEPMMPAQYCVSVLSGTITYEDDDWLDGIVHVFCTYPNVTAPNGTTTMEGSTLWTVGNQSALRSGETFVVPPVLVAVTEYGNANESVYTGWQGWGVAAVEDPNSPGTPHSDPPITLKNIAVRASAGTGQFVFDDIYVVEGATGCYTILFGVIFASDTVKWSDTKVNLCYRNEILLVSWKGITPMTAAPGQSFIPQMTVLVSMDPMYNSLMSIGPRTLNVWVDSSPLSTKVPSLLTSQWQFTAPSSGIVEVPLTGLGFSDNSPLGLYTLRAGVASRETEESAPIELTTRIASMEIASFLPSTGQVLAGPVMIGEEYEYNVKVVLRGASGAQLKSGSVRVSLGLNAGRGEFAETSKTASISGSGIVPELEASIPVLLTGGVTGMYSLIVSAPSSGAEDIETVQFSVMNPIVDVLILVNPPTNIDNDVIFDPNDQPIVMVVFGFSSIRKEGWEVHVEVVPVPGEGGGRGARVAFEEDALTDVDGRMAFKTMHFNGGASGGYQLRFSIAGMDSSLSKITQMRNVQDVDFSDLREWESYMWVAVAAAIPIFLANNALMHQPYWIPIGSAVSGILMAQVAGASTSLREDDSGSPYFAVLSIVYITVLVALPASFVFILAQAVVRIRSHRADRPIPHWAKGYATRQEEDQYALVRRLLSPIQVCLKKEEKMEEESLEPKKKGKVEKVKDFGRKMVLNVKSWMWGPPSRWSRFETRRDFRFPLRMIFAMTASLLVLLCSVMGAMLLTQRFAFNIKVWYYEMLAYESNMKGDVERFNDAILAMERGNELASNIPGTPVGSIPQFDVGAFPVDEIIGTKFISILPESMVPLIQYGVTAAGNGTALGVGLFMLIGIGLMLRTYRLRMFKMRRGDYFMDPSQFYIVPVTKYIGLQVAHFAVAFFVMFFIISPVVCIFIIIFYFPALRAQFLATVGTALLALLSVAGIVQLVTSLVARYRLVVNGRIAHRRFFNMLDFWFIWITVASGVVTALLRVVISLLITILTFVRLDNSQFATSFASYDTAYAAYCSMVLLDERANNPILNTFCGLLWKRIKLQRKIRKAQLFSRTQPSGFKEDSWWARVKNVFVEAATMGGSDVLKTAPSAQSPSHRRASVRWNLLYTLAMNPQLCAERAHRRREMAEKGIVGGKLDKDTSEGFLGMVI